jgi:hypothetical protein
LILLKDLVHARSGDKGDTCNICVFARRPEYYAYLREVLTSEKVKAFLGALVQGEVRRYDLPKLHGFNFVLQGALDGGATVSLRLDTLGKTMASALLRMKLSVPPELRPPGGEALGCT